MQNKRLTINLDERNLKGLKVLAKRDGRSVSNYLRARIEALVNADPTVFAPAVHEEIKHTDSVRHAEAAR